MSRSPNQIERNSVYYEYNLYSPNNANWDESISPRVIQMLIGLTDLGLRSPKWAVTAAKTKLHNTLMEIIPASNLHRPTNNSFNAHAHEIPKARVESGAFNNYIVVELRKNMTQNEINALKNKLANKLNTYGDVNVKRKIRSKAGMPSGNPRVVKKSISKQGVKRRGN